MAYTVVYRGHQVTCDTASDLDALLGRNGSKPSTMTANLKAESSRVHTLIGKLNKEQLSLVRQVLANAPIKRDRLRSAIGVEDAHQFAGILIGISKYAQNMGMRSPIKIDYEREDGRGPRIYQYSIRKEMVAAVKEALSMIE